MAIICNFGKIYFCRTMYVYNVTLKVELSVHDEWLDWMKKNHIPEVMNTQCFVNHKIYRILEQDDSDGFTYAIQYFCENKKKYEEYHEKFAMQLQQKHFEKYKDKFIAFRTLMQLI